MYLNARLHTTSVAQTAPNATPTATNVVHLPQIVRNVQQEFILTTQPVYLLVQTVTMEMIKLKPVQPVCFLVGHAITPIYV